MLVVLAPQIPALAFSLARLAKFGPWLDGVFVFLIPAPALAEDHSEPKASPPEEAEDLATGLVKELLDWSNGFGPRADVGFAVLGTGTEVK